MKYAKNYGSNFKVIQRSNETKYPMDTKVGIMGEVRVPKIRVPISRSSEAIKRSNETESPFATKVHMWGDVRGLNILVSISRSSEDIERSNPQAKSLWDQIWYAFPDEVQI